MNPAYPTSPALAGLECLRCGERYPVADFPVGCPACLAAGWPANLFCVYAEPPPAGRVHRPYPGTVTLGEGGTPLLDHAGPDGVEVRLKWEGANPTGSHKDRFSAVAVTHALAGGYDTVAAASSGNAGVSLAAYCARAGLGCEIAVAEDAPAAVLGQMRDLGAAVLTFPDAPARWRHLARYADSTTTLPVTNFHTPPVGSNAFGIEGYKVIAEELLADPGGRPDWIVVPASRGDLAWGIHRGLLELGGDLGGPRICLVEPFPRVTRVLAGADVRGRFPGATAVMPSLAGDTVAVQAVEAVRRTAGHVEVVDDDRVTAETRRLWHSGFPVEPSSAAAVLATTQAVESGVIKVGSRVVVMATAHGLKGM
jgi:threonine synthase